MSSVPVVPEPRQQLAIEVTAYLSLGCMAVIGLPFFLIGSGVLISSLARARGGAADAIFFGAFGAVFALAGLFMIGTAVASIRELRTNAQLRRQHPNEPWRWRREWATGRIPDAAQRPIVRLAIFAVVWNGFVVAFGSMVRPEAFREYPLMYLTLLLPLVGVVALGGLAYALLRRRKFRQSFLAMTSMPGRPGETLRGSIETTIPSEIQMTDGAFVLKLRRVREYVTGSGKHQSRHETTLWESETRVPFVSCTPGPYGGVMVPVSFAIPADAAPTNNANPRDQIVWRVYANAELPGIDYVARWDVPVF